MVWKGNYQDDWSNFEIFQKKLLKWLKLFWNFSKEIITRISGGVERKHWCRSWRRSGGKQGRPFLISTCFAFFFTFLCFFLTFWMILSMLELFCPLEWYCLNSWWCLEAFENFTLLWMLYWYRIWIYASMPFIVYPSLNSKWKKILWEEFSWTKGGGCGQLFAPWQLWWPVCCQRSSTPVEVLWPHYSYNGQQSLTLLN